MLLLTILTLISTGESIPAGMTLHYRGRLVAEQGDTAASEKQFEVTFMLGERVDGVIPAYWTSEERGRGVWIWPDRLGRWELDENMRPQGGVGPALFYERPEGVSVVPVPPPFLTYSEPFAVGISWLEGTHEFQVAGSEKVNGSETWRIEVKSPIGRRRVFWVEKASPVIVAASETVFIGQGEPHQLRWELASRRTAAPATLAAASAAFEELLRLRTRLAIEPRTRDLRWTAERLELLRADLPGVTEKARGTLLEDLVKVIDQESKNQKQRNSALGALHGKLVGRPAPQPDLETIQAGSPKFSWPDIQGKVAVLHFWEYRETPLEEPYGQVAYLDFLARQHDASQVKVYGVVVEDRLLQPETKRAAIQSARKLQAFMNLSYPLLADPGTAIKEFGDPRVTGAKLPLFVVIDRKGKIIHYHAGFYEVNRDRGLEELAAVVRQALEQE
jgi:alkyl hydroperoxide reductase subunit AhpC